MYEDECEQCVNEPCATSSEFDEGPYGGAFADWDDFYRWKNGSITI